MDGTLANAATPTNPGDLDTLTEAEREQAQQNQIWWYGHSGYAAQMSTRPQTLAYALNDSPRWRTSLGTGRSAVWLNCRTRSLAGRRCPPAVTSRHSKPPSFWSPTSGNSSGR